MLVATTDTQDGEPITIIGLDHENLDRLRAARPAESHVPGLPHVVVLGGETLRDIVAQLVQVGWAPASALDDYVAPADPGTVSTWTPSAGTVTERAETCPEAATGLLGRTMTCGRRPHDDGDHVDPADGTRWSRAAAPTPGVRAAPPLPGHDPDEVLTAPGPALDEPTEAFAALARAARGAVHVNDGLRGEPLATMPPERIHEAIALQAHAISLLDEATRRAEDVLAARGIVL